jgi:4-diphosphocytidyl-2-C-methyl-D-erythritol kinase
MQQRTLLAPAKVNLALHIESIRADRYHVLDSLVVPVALFDEIDIRFQSPAPPRTAVKSDVTTAPEGARNLAFSAVELVRSLTSAPFAVEIDLRKRIPVGSGLGGGSSDAATVLRFLNHMLGSPLELPALTAAAATLGADVPFFVHGCPARVRGIGEVVTPLETTIAADLVLCSPGISLSTGRVFAEFDRSHPGKPADSLTSRRRDSNIADFIDGRRPISELLANDLEEAAARICPDVRSLKQELLDLGALGASMTGSGSTVFGICSDAASAERIAAALRRKGLWTWPTKTLAASPGVEC